MTDETTTQRDAERLAHIREKYRGLQGDMPPFGDVLILLRLLDARDAALREQEGLIKSHEEELGHLQLRLQSVRGENRFARERLLILAKECLANEAEIERLRDALKVTPAEGEPR